MRRRRQRTVHCSVLSYSPEFDTVVVMLYNNDAADPELSLADMVNPVFSLLRTQNRDTIISTRKALFIRDVFRHVFSLFS